MKNPIRKVTLKQLHDFCLKNGNHEFFMDTDKQCFFAQYAKKVLNMKPVQGSFCCFNFNADKTTIMFNDKQIADFPQSVIDMVYDMVYGYGEKIFTGKQLARKIAKFIK